jgi:TonB family protein
VARFETVPRVPYINHLKKNPMKRILTAFALAALLITTACTNQSEKADTMQPESGKSARAYEDVDGEQVYTVVENQPEFDGGLPAMYTFLSDNIRYPEAAAKANVQGKVTVAFVVGADGAVRNVKVMEGLGYGTDEEALRVVKAMPNWQPGSQDGKNVAVKYFLPISFQLGEKKAQD